MEPKTIGSLGQCLILFLLGPFSGCEQPLVLFRVCKLHDANFKSMYILTWQWGNVHLLIEKISSFMVRVSNIASLLECLFFTHETVFTFHKVYTQKKIGVPI